MSTATIAPSTVSARRQWIVLILLVISVCINYVDRGNLSVASVDLKDALHLGPQSLGNLLAAFFWTYAGFMVFAGMLVEKYNVIWVYAIGYFLWSLATALTGFTNSYTMLFLLRLLLGMSESVAYPSYSKIIAAGFPERQRGVANGLIDAGSKLGPALGMVIGGMILAEWGWRTLFISVGAISLLWLIPWCAIAPKIRTEKLARNHDAPSFGEILSKRDTWATFLCLFCGNYGWYFMLTWIPGYLRLERHYTIEQMALFGSLPFFAVAGGAVLGGFLSDAWVRLGSSATRVRKTFTATGLTACAVLILPSAIVQDRVTAMSLLIAASFVYGLWSSNHWAVTQTLAGPTAAGKWTGLQNCAGNMAGVAAPTITGFVVERFGSFYYAFLSVSILLVVGAFSYVFLIGPIETHQWKKRA